MRTAFLRYDLAKLDLLNVERKIILPRSIRDFVEQRQTVPLESLLKDSDSPSYPYSEYWRRAVAATLLSGRVTAKDDGFPNMTEVNRICKEANFNQYLFEHVGRFLVTAKIIQPNERSSRYEPAKFSDAFWNRQFGPLQEATHRAFLDLASQCTPTRVWRSTSAVRSKLDALVALFVTAFAGLAVPRDQVGNVFLKFSKLPPADLLDLCAQLGLDIPEWQAESWDE